MSDNTQVTNGSGDVIRDIDRGGVKTQVVQIDVGGASGESLASASNPVPVTLPAAQVAALTPPTTVGITGTVPVSVSNLPATQAISAAALPLPAGAATAAGVAAVVTALGTPLQAGATVPVSAAALPLPTGAATAAGVAAVVAALGTPAQAGGAVSVSNFPATQPISAAALPLPAGAATAAGVAAVATALGTPLQAGGSVSVSNLPSLQGVSLNATGFIESTSNTTIAQLAAGATFSGAIDSIQSQQTISVDLVSDQPGTLTLNQYTDLAGAHLIASWQFTIAAGAPFARSFTANGNYFALSFQNTGSVATTTLVIDTAYGTLMPATNLGNVPIAINEINGNTATADLYNGAPYLHVDPSNAGTDGSTYNAANFPQVGVVAGRGTDGNAHAVSVDSAGNLNVNVSSGGNSPAAALPVLGAPDNASYAAIVGDPSGDFANVDLMSALLDDSQGMAARVKVTNPPLADVTGAARASDAPAAIPLTGGVGTIITIDTTGYESLNITSLSMAANVTASDDPSANFVALSGTNRTIAAAYVTAVAANNGYSFPCIARFVRLTLTTAGTGVAYLRAAPWAAGYSTPLPSNVSQINGTAPVTANVAGTLAVGGNVAPAAAPTMYPLPTGSVDAAGLTRRVLSDAAGALTVGGVDPNGTQRQIKTDPLGFMAVQQAPTTPGAPNPAETLLQILGQLKVLTIYMRELSSALNAGVPIADDEAAILNDLTLFN